jgi:hypothetical protein
VLRKAGCFVVTVKEFKAKKNDWKAKTLKFF